MYYSGKGSNCLYEVRRGDIYFINLGGNENKGSEQKGLRPCVVVQNDTGNKFSKNIIVVPMTTKNKHKLPTHVNLSLKGTPSTVLCECMRTVSKERITEFVCCIDDATMKKIDTALLVSLGLDK